MFRRYKEFKIMGPRDPPLGQIFCSKHLGRIRVNEFFFLTFKSIIQFIHHWYYTTCSTDTITLLHTKTYSTAQEALFCRLSVFNSFSSLPKMKMLSHNCTCAYIHTYLHELYNIYQKQLLFVIWLLFFSNTHFLYKVM